MFSCEMFHSMSGPKVTHGMVLRRYCHEYQKSRNLFHQKGVWNCSCTKLSDVNSGVCILPRPSTFQVKNRKQSGNFKDSLENSSRLSRKEQEKNKEEHADDYHSTYSITSLQSNNDKLINYHSDLPQNSHKDYTGQMARTVYDKRADLLNGDVLYLDGDTVVQRPSFSVRRAWRATRVNSAFQQSEQEDKSLSLHSSFADRSSAKDINHETGILYQNKSGINSGEELRSSMTDSVFQQTEQNEGSPNLTKRLNSYLFARNINNETKILNKIQSKNTFGEVHAVDDDDGGSGNSLFGCSFLNQDNGNCGGYVMLWRKWLYFILSKPTHWDVENLSRISTFGKKKVIAILLLPLIMYLLCSTYVNRLPLHQVEDISENSIMNDKSEDLFTWNFIKNFLPSVQVENMSHVSALEDIPVSKSMLNMNMQEIKTLVQRLVFEELDAFQFLLKQQEHKVWTNQELNKVRKEFSTLQVEFKLFLDDFKSKETNVKQSEILDLKTSSQDVDIQLDKFNKRLNLIEKKFYTIDTFLNNFKNCCHNETKLPSLVQLHMIDLFESSFVASSCKACIRLKNFQHLIADTSPELRPFRNWLFSNFIDSQKLSTELNAKINGIKVEQEVTKELLMETLKQRIDAVSTSFSDSTGNTLSDNSISKIESLIKKAILTYDADKTGQTDYALESGGGSVISTRCSETFTERNPRISVLGFPLWYGTNSPRNAIQPSLHPGQCWAFKGNHGYLVIQLATVIRPTGFVIEHIPKSISPTGNIASAPKEFSVYGLESEKESEGKLLGKYFYDIDGDPLQYFPVQTENTIYYNFVELKIHSNHGELNYTCLYRFRVHGLHS